MVDVVQTTKGKEQGLYTGYKRKYSRHWNESGIDAGGEGFSERDVSKQVLSGSTQFHGCLKQVGHVLLNHWDSCSKTFP